MSRISGGLSAAEHLAAAEQCTEQAIDSTIFPGELISKIQTHMVHAELHLLRAKVLMLRAEMDGHQP